MRGHSLRWALFSIVILILIQSVSAATHYVSQMNVLTIHNPLGLLIPLGIENFVPIADSIMYYNYIAIGLIMLIAAFAGQSNETRFTFFIPVFAGLMTYIGWLRAPDPTAYWGMIVGCILLGALMYLNDMNHEKYGLPGPGSKLLTIVFMIIVFEASVTLVSTSGLNIFPDMKGNAGRGQQDIVCQGYGMTCDANGNIMPGASVTSVINAGGANLSVASIVSWTIQATVGVLVFMLKILAAIFLFSGVLVAAYPMLAQSPQALLFLGILQLVIWAVYVVAMFNWLYRPSFETAAV